MSILENHRLIVKICELYYHGNLSQKAIHTKLGISRPQISRVLKHARTKGIVSIKINNPYGNETVLEKELVQRFNLVDAFVFDTGELTESDALAEFSKQAARQIDIYLPRQGCIGIMSGKTIAQLMNHIRDIDKKGLIFVPLIGGMGSSGADWHANIIAKAFANETGGNYYLLNAPVLVTNRASKDILLHEPDISTVMQRGEKCDVAILGIGEINEGSTSVVAGALSIEEIGTLQKLGAVASVCGSYVDQDGKIIENEITERMIGQTLKTLGGAKRIAVALGKHKVEAIKAVLQGKHIDILLTNSTTAKKILNYNQEGKK